MNNVQLQSYIIAGSEALAAAPPTSSIAADTCGYLPSQFDCGLPRPHSVHAILKATPDIQKPIPQRGEKLWCSKVLQLHQAKLPHLLLPNSCGG